MEILQGFQTMIATVSVREVFALEKHWISGCI